MAWRDRHGVSKVAGLAWPRITCEVAPSKIDKHHGRGYDCGWPVLRKAAKVRPEVRWHDLRHTCASHLVSGTWGRAWRLEEVQAVLGHSSSTTTQRYAHLAPEALMGAARAATAAWAEPVTTNAPSDHVVAAKKTEPTGPRKVGSKVGSHVGSKAKTAGGVK